MAESSEHNKHTMDKLADDLDSMLDETDDSMKQQQELIDDAIDQLLMDNAFDSPEKEEADEFAEIDELINESLEDSEIQPVSKVENIVDEFGDDDNDLVAKISENQKEIDSVVSDESIGNDEAEAMATEDKLVDADSSDVESMNEIDEFADTDSTQNNSAEPSDQEDLMADFDISADEAEEEIDKQDEVQVEPDIVQTLETEAEDTAKANQIEEKNIPAATVNDSVFADINSQLAALQNAQQMVNQQINDLNSKDNTVALTDELEGLQSDQKKLKRRLNTIEEKKPVLAYAALAVAVVAFLLGGGLGIVGFQANSKVNELSDTVVGIEDELDAQAEKDTVNKLNAITKRLDRMDSEVAAYSAQLASIKKTMEAMSNQNDVGNLHKQLAQLGNQGMQMGAAIESLELQLDGLENKRHATRKKTAVHKYKWVVNLISFKQEWYAKRKAAEFEKQGIPVEVIKAVVKNKTWYRLRVKGFDSKFKAATYAAKVKKSLNLTSVWVTKDESK